jgi:predicted ester cyclase
MKVVRRLLGEVWSEGNIALLPELLAADCSAHPMPQMGALTGPEEYMQFIGIYKSAFKDMSFHIEDQFAGDNKVATRWVSTVTEPGEGPGAGEQIAIDGITITHHRDDGRIIGEWGTWDTHALVESAAAPQIYGQLSMKV